MIKHLRRFPTTLDIEIVYFLSNLWWLVVFISPPGIFSGIAYNRAIYYLQQDLLVTLLTLLIVVSIVAFTRREFVQLALLLGPLGYIYFGVESLLGDTIVINAGVLLLVACLGIYRLFSFTYYRDKVNENGTTASARN